MQSPVSMRLQPAAAAAAAALILTACAASKSSDAERLGNTNPNDTSTPADTDTKKYCDVIIAGGSTAAFAAALSSAHAGVKTCLIEPTDWVGGQLTASGVPAVDFPHDVSQWEASFGGGAATAGMSRENITPNFWDMLQQVGSGNPGQCWVSAKCFEPKNLLATGLLVSQKNSPTLHVFTQTVVKSVQTDGAGHITALATIQRTAINGDGWDLLPDQDLPDWYSPNNSARFTKKQMTFSLGVTGKFPAVIDATDWGEVLALSGASYLIGSEKRDGDTVTGDESCGVGSVFPFTEMLTDHDVTEGPDPAHVDRPDSFSLLGDTWDQIWTYRRLRSSGAGAKAGDISVQNWGAQTSTGQSGNDYIFGYLYKNKAETAAEVGDWRGGMDLGQMAAAERQALGWHWFLKMQSPNPSRVVLDGEALGTRHGLSKLPYMRDSRRSIGIQDFVLRASDISVPVAQGVPTIVGNIFPDRVALGWYGMDKRLLTGCGYPGNVEAYALPYYIPLRALTNRDFSNLLVAGKTMAQSWNVNAATRLQPIEWSSGTAAGVAAAKMAREDLSTTALYTAHLAELQAAVALRTPIAWTFNGVKYPLGN